LDEMEKLKIKKKIENNIVVGSCTGWKQHAKCTIFEK